MITKLPPLTITNWYSIIKYSDGIIIDVKRKNIKSIKMDEAEAAVRVSASLKAEFGAEFSGFEQLGDTLKMGFSGAEIRVLRVSLAQNDRREQKVLVLKKLKMQAALLPVD